MGNVFILLSLFTHWLFLQLFPSILLNYAALFTRKSPFTVDVNVNVCVGLDVIQIVSMMTKGYSTLSFHFLFVTIASLFFKYANPDYDAKCERSLTFSSLPISTFEYDVNTNVRCEQTLTVNALNRIHIRRNQCCSRHNQFHSGSRSNKCAERKGYVNCVVECSHWPTPIQTPTPIK